MESVWRESEDEVFLWQLGNGCVRIIGEKSD